MADDKEEIMEEEDESFIKKEEKEIEEDYKEKEKHSNITPIFMGIVIGMVLLGAIFFGFIYSPDEGDYNHCVAWGNILRENIPIGCYDFQNTIALCEWKIDDLTNELTLFVINPNTTSKETLYSQQFHFNCTRYVKSIKVQP